MIARKAIRHVFNIYFVLNNQETPRLIIVITARCILALLIAYTSIIMAIYKIKQDKEFLQFHRANNTPLTI